MDSLTSTEDCEPVQPVQPVNPPRRLGGNSDQRAPTADEIDLLETDTLRVSIQGVSCDEYASIEIVALRSQVVAGTNY